MPQSSAICEPRTRKGGVNDLYFIPCSEVMSETNILDVDWWTTLVTDNKLGNIGLGIGSIAKKTVKTEKIASCRPEQIVGATWALKYTVKIFDETSADKTTEQLNAIIQRFRQFSVIARMCDGTDRVLPIGTFATSDFDWVVPENSEDAQSVTFELSWEEFAKPKTYDVAGLSAVVPKA
jgi:hypothetical protein